MTSDLSAPSGVDAFARHLFGRLPKRRRGPDLRAEIDAWEKSGEACRSLGHVYSEPSYDRCAACGKERS